ncbi:hypothetical protein ACJX0J_019924, partial [Zea mays]
MLAFITIHGRIGMLETKPNLKYYSTRLSKFDENKLMKLRIGNLPFQSSFLTLSIPSVIKSNPELELLALIIISADMEQNVYGHLFKILF